MLVEKEISFAYEAQLFKYGKNIETFQKGLFIIINKEISF